MPFLTKVLPPRLPAAANLLLFVCLVILGTLLLQTAVFRVYLVVGPSMEATLFTGDRLIVNKIPHALASITQKPFIPHRSDIIVFKNPLFQLGSPEEYVVKRVIGLPGERVVVREGKITIYNHERPEGFNPDVENTTIQQPTSGNVDRLIPENEIFVAGDNRTGQYSLDSRNGMSTIPLRELEGVVTVRVFPFDKIRLL